MERNNKDFFVVKDEAAVAALSDWLRERKFTSFRDTLRDKNGKPMVGLRDGLEHRGLILCLSEKLMPSIIETVKRYCIPA